MELDSLLLLSQSGWSIERLLLVMTNRMNGQNNAREASGRVTVTRDQNGEPFDWNLVIGDLLNIRSQDDPPENAAVAVNYRDSWFYIDDSDISSKYTFMLLGVLTSLQAGSIERAGPILTLPVGGR